MFIYVLIFIAGTSGGAPTTSFSQEFFDQKTCQEALTSLKQNIKVYQYAECHKK